jgi:hypothetical protein
MTILIVLDSSLRFQTSHPEIERRAIHGYVTMSQDEYLGLSESVKQSLEPYKRQLMVCALGGNC